MSGKKISARDFLNDIRAGMNDADLIQKYDLPPSKLAAIYEKLIAAGHLKLAEINRVAHGFECPACGKKAKQKFDECPACGVVITKYLAGIKKAESESPPPKAPAGPVASNPTTPPQEKPAFTLLRFTGAVLGWGFGPLMFLGGLASFTRMPVFALFMLAFGFLILPPVWRKVFRLKKQGKYTGNYLCTVCESLCQGVSHTKGSFWIEIVLWFALIVPGIIYSIWRLTTSETVCPHCRSNSMIPETSPAARRILAGAEQGT